MIFGQPTVTSLIVLPTTSSTSDFRTVSTSGNSGISPYPLLLFILHHTKLDHMSTPLLMVRIVLMRVPSHPERFLSIFRFHLLVLRRLVHHVLVVASVFVILLLLTLQPCRSLLSRSEERRVGIECS